MFLSFIVCNCEPIHIPYDDMYFYTSILAILTSFTFTGPYYLTYYFFPFFLSLAAFYAFYAYYFNLIYIYYFVYSLSYV